MGITSNRSTSDNGPKTWSQVGVYTAADPIERIHHAGLDEDGRYCFIASADDEVYLSWDIREGKTIWVQDGVQSSEESPALEDWIDNGYIEIEEGAAKVRYRIFGLIHN